MATFWAIFTLLTGILYLILEIRQHSFMWVVGVLTSSAAMITFISDHLIASFLLNAYYLITAIIGLVQWRRDASSTSTSDNSSTSSKEGDGSSNNIRVRKLTWKVALISAASFAVLTPLFSWALQLLGDPKPVLDVLATMLSAIATIWLIRCYKEQWLLWIIADIMSTILCLKVALAGESEMWWMTVLYAAYTVSAVYGYWHWKRHAKVIE